MFHVDMLLYTLDSLAHVAFDNLYLAPDVWESNV